MINSNIAKPLHIQQIEKALDVKGFLKQVYSFIDDKTIASGSEDAQIVPLRRKQVRAAKSMVYNVVKVEKSKKWLKSLMLEKSDSENSSSDTDEAKSAEIDELLKMHSLQKVLRNPNSQNRIRKPLSVVTKEDTKSEVSTSKDVSHIAEHEKQEKTEIMDSSKLEEKIEKFKSNLPFSEKIPVIKPILEVPPLKLESRLMDEIMYDPMLPDEILQCESAISEVKFVSNCTPSLTDEIIYSHQLPDEIFDTEDETSTPSTPRPSSKIENIINNEQASSNVNQCKSQVSIRSPTPINDTKKRIPRKKELSIEALNAKRRRLWISMARKEVPKAYKQKMALKKEMLSSCKKIANMCSRDRRNAFNGNKQGKERNKKMKDSSCGNKNSIKLERVLKIDESNTNS